MKGVGVKLKSYPVAYQSTLGRRQKLCLHICEVQGSGFRLGLGLGLGLGFGFRLGFELGLEVRGRG